eukprot:2198645-Pleurochrysis_carterae.AAC.1
MTWELCTKTASFDGALFNHRAEKCDISQSGMSSTWERIMNYHKRPHNLQGIGETRPKLIVSTACTS